MLQSVEVFNPFSTGKTFFETQRGRAFGIRQAYSCDTPELIQLFLQLSARTCLLRYMTPLPGFTLDRAQKEASRLTRNLPELQKTLVATVQEAGVEKIIAVAELVRNNLSDPFEIAIIVQDAYQGEGIGKTIMRSIVALAQLHGLGQLQAYILSENIAMRKIIRGLSFRSTSKTVQGEIILTIHLNS